MKTLFIECGMGVAGDMLTAALVNLFDDEEKIVKELNDIGIPGVTYSLNKITKAGILTNGMTVEINGEVEGEPHHHHEDHEEHHHHSSMADIEHIVRDHIKVSDEVKDEVMKVYRIIAEAESSVHNTTVEEVHFHEVGMMDAIADITAVCYLIHKLGVEEIVVSPIHVGRGFVKCAHGILPVPAPATAYILKDVPIYSREEVEGELCTPTGAALVTHFASYFKTLPTMKINKIGYGTGKKEFAIPSFVRCFLGETAETERFVVELSFNVDDMTGEEIGYATQTLLTHGASEVYTTPINMKKNRPGILITVICSEEKRDEMVQLIFKHTTTVGMRECRMSRHVLDRDIKEIEVDGKKIRIKSTSGYGVEKEKIEYEDLIKLAEAEESDIYSIRNTILKYRKS